MRSSMVKNGCLCRGWRTTPTTMRSNSAAARSDDVEVPVGDRVVGARDRAQSGRAAVDGVTSGAIAKDLDRRGAVAAERVGGQVERELQAARALDHDQRAGREHGGDELAKRGSIARCGVYRADRAARGRSARPRRASSRSTRSNVDAAHAARGRSTPSASTFARRQAMLAARVSANRQVAAPRESASSPSAPEPANRSSTATPVERPEPREQRLARAIGGRPRRVAARRRAGAGRRARRRRSSSRRPIRSTSSPKRSRDRVLEHRVERARAQQVARVGARARDAARRWRARLRVPQVGRARLALAGELALAAHAQVELGQLEAARVLAQRLEPPSPPSLGSDDSNRKQYDWSLPRPTRPRSWCSCARPKRSAFSITIAVAFGMSMPTSITVVATSTCISRGGERAHRRPRARPPSAGRARAPTRSGSSALDELARARPRRRAPARSRSPRRASRRRRPGGRAPATARRASGSSRRACRRGTRCVLIGCRPGGQLAQLGDVEVAVQRERERARDRRRRHVQRVRAVRLGERGALLDAEAVLLVDDVDEQAVELDARLEQRVRADDERGVARGDALQAHAALGRRDVAGDQLDLEAERLEQRCARSRRAAGRASRSAPSARPGRRPRRRAASACTATTVLPEPTSPSSSRRIGRGGARSRSSSRTLRFWPRRERERQAGVVALAAARRGGRAARRRGARRARRRRSASCSSSSSS